MAASSGTHAIPLPALPIASPIDIEREITSKMWNKQFAYQKDAIVQAVRWKGRALFAHQPGVGKGRPALGTAFYFRKYAPIYIIAPAGKLKEWVDESIDILEVDRKQVVILTGKNMPSIDIPRSSVIIMSYERAVKVAHIFNQRRVAHEMTMMANKKIGKPSKGHGGVMDNVIVDESHRLQDPNSKTTIALMHLLKSSRHCIMMSGTPMPNCQKNLFPQLHILRPDLFPSWLQFRDRYCDPKLVPAKNGAPQHIDDKGSSNVAELNRLLEQNVMVRKKSNDPDVLMHTKLPPIEYTTVYFEPTAEERAILKDSLQTYDDFVREKLLPKAQGNKRMSDYCRLALANGEEVRVEKKKRESKHLKKRGFSDMQNSPFSNRTTTFASSFVSSTSSFSTSTTSTITTIIEERPSKSIKLEEEDDVTKAINECLSKNSANTGTTAHINQPTLAPLPGNKAPIFASRTVDKPDEEMKQAKPKRPETANNQAKRNFFELVTKAVSFKTKPMMNYIVERMQKIPAGEKGLFFGYRKFILDTLCECADMAGVKYIRIDGKVPREKRDAIFDKFKTKDSYQVAILSIGACGTGINLTCASHVYICELLYTFEKVKQAIARAYRNGQKRNVYVYICLLLGSIEERIWQINRNKLKLESNTLDNTTEFFQSNRIVIPCEKEPDDNIDELAMEQDEDQEVGEVAAAIKKAKADTKDESTKKKKKRQQKQKKKPTSNKKPDKDKGAKVKKQSVSKIKLKQPSKLVSKQTKKNSKN